MDPNETLREMRALSARIAIGTRVRHADVERLAELVTALDLWMSRGGFLPSAWGTRVVGVEVGD